MARCRVLVVEDEYFIADDVARALRDQGVQVVGPIGNLDDAMKQVKRDGFDIAVLDINLHEEMAYAIADELTRQRVPFVFATGYSSGVIPERFRDVERWEKPYDEHALMQSIVRLCPAA